MKKFLFLLLVLWTLTEAAIDDLPPLKCIVQNPTQPPFKPDFPLPMCGFLDELTCCSYRDAVQVQRTFNSSFQPNLSSSPLCRNNLETLWCGASCAPSQPFHVNLYEYTFVICSSFCRRIFETCRSPALDSQYASSSDPALSFCQQQLIYNFSVIVNDGVECYNGLTIDTASAHSIAVGRGLVPGVAGFNYNFTVKAHDEFTNSRTQGNEYFEAFFTPGVPSNVDDNNDGTYLVSFTPQATLYNISVVVNGESIYKSPFAVFFENQTTCVTKNGAPPTNPAQTPAGKCQPYYTETSCCNNADAGQINSALTNVSQIYGDSQQCTSRLENIACALTCDPRQSLFIRGVNSSSGNNTTPLPGQTIYNVSICREYCTQLIDSCGSVRLPGGFTVKDYYQTGDFFCASALPELFQGYIFGVTSSVCFGGNDLYPTSPPDSYPYGRDLNKTTACQASYFNIHTRDKYRNDRTSGGDDWHVVFNGPSTQFTNTSIGEVFDSQNGDYSVFYNLTKAGIYSVSASLNLQDFLSQSPWKLVVYPGKMDPNNTFASGPGVTSAPVGLLTSFIINTRDACGNDLITGGNIFNVSIVFPNGTVIHPTPIDNKDGTYIVPWLPPITGTYTVIITNSSGYPIKNSPYTVVVFGDLDVCRTRIVGVNQTQAGNLTTFRILTYDVTGNAYGLGGLSWTAAVSGDFISEKGRFFNANDTVHVTDNGDGTYNVSFIPFVAKPVQVFIALRSSVNRSCSVGVNATVFVLPGPLDPRTTEAIGDATSVGYLNVDNVFLIQGRDSWDNSLKTGGDVFSIRFTGPGRVTFSIVDNMSGTYTVIYVPDTPGVYVMTIITKGSQIVGSPFIINVGAAPGGVYSTADGPGLETGVAGKTNIFLITAFDESGSRVYTGGDNYNVIISLERTSTRSLRADPSAASQAITVYALPFTNGFRFVSPFDRSIHVRKTDNTDGTYTVQYITNVAGFYNVTIGSLAPRSTGPIIGSPWRVKIYPDVIYPDYSPVSGPGTTGGTVGQIIPFYIQGKDKYNNTLESGGDVIQVTFFTLGGVNVTSNFTTEIIDNRNGTYSVNYATTLAGKFIMNVNLFSSNPLECRRFMGSPFLITIKPLGADCPSSIARGPGLSVAIADLSSTASNYFYIQARDYFGNLVPAAGLTFDLAFEQNGVYFPPDAFSYTRRDFGNGTYLINFFVIGDGFVYMHVLCPGGVEIYQSPFLIEIIGQPCQPPDCNGNGACIGGQCQCRPPFLPPDCKNPGPVAAADCRFSDLGVHILCDFPLETDRAGKRRYFECSEFFNVSDTTEFFAEGNFCYWRSYSRIAIALGNNPDVRVNDTLVIRAGQFKPRFASYDSQPNVEIRAVIQPPLNYPYPKLQIVSWTRGPTSRPLVLDASGSTGTAGRDFVSGYNWTLVSSPSNASLSAINNLLTTPPATNTGIVTFPAGLLAPGSYRFRLDATNYFNKSGYVETTVTVFNQTMPDVYVNGPKNITARVFNDLFFTGIATTTTGDLSFSWSRIEGPLLPTQLSAISSGKLKNFYIPAYTLIPNSTYVFEFSSSLLGNSSGSGNFSNFDIVTVHVLDPLEPVINPGERTVFRLFPLTLNASDTVAFNTDPSTYAFSWTCYNNESPDESCVDEAARMYYFQSNPLVTLPGASLHPGLYTFTVSVQRGGQLQSASTAINITMENTTVVSFSRQGLSANLPKHNFEDLLRLDVSIFGIGNTTTAYTWEVSPPDFDLTDPVTVGPTNEPFLVINPFWPVGNVLYNFTIYNATFGDPIGTIGVLVNEPPLGGVCDLTPLSGDSNTLFTVRCQEWEDDDLPIYYHLIYIDPDGVENPLFENPSSSNVLQFKLPPSVPAGNPTQVKILVRDALGSFTNVTFYIDVGNTLGQKRQTSADTLLSGVYAASDAGLIEAETQALFNLFTYLNFIAPDTLPTDLKRTIRSTAMVLIYQDYQRVPNSDEGIELKLKLILALTQQPNEVNETAVGLIDQFLTTVLSLTTTTGTTANLARYTLQTLGRMIAANQFIDPNFASVYSRSTVNNLNRLALSVVALDIPGQPAFSSQATICFNVSVPYYQNSSIYLVTVNATRDPNFARLISDPSSSNTTKVEYCTSIFLQAKKDSTNDISRIFTHQDSGTSIVVPASVTQETLQAQLSNAQFVISSFWVSTTDPFAFQINFNRINAYINSPVASLAYYANGQKLVVMNSQDPVAITLINYSPLTHPEYLRCRFWDQDWTDNDCVVNDASSNQTVCYCNHLTEFSVLMRPYVTVPSGGFGYQSAIAPLGIEEDSDKIDQWWLFALVLGLGLLTLLFALWHRQKRAGYVNIDDYAKRATMVITLNEEDTREPIALNDEAALGLGVPLMRKRAKFAISKPSGEFESDVEDTPRTMTQISIKSGEESARSESVEKRTESHATSEGSEEEGTGGSAEEEASESKGSGGSGGSGSQAKGSGSDRSLSHSDQPKESEEEEDDGKSGTAEEDDD